MTHWLLLFSNPVVFSFTAGCILIILYLVQQANPEAAFWSLTILSTLLFALLYAAISVVKQIRGRQTANNDGQLYHVFAQEDVVLLQLGNNLNKLAKNPQDIMRSLSDMRLQLAERYGFVVPDLEMEYSSNLAPQTVQVLVRQDTLGQFDVYPDCLAVPVDHTQMTLTDRIDNQLYAWTPNEEVSLQDRAVALTAREFMSLKVQSMLLDNAPQVMTRTDAMKLMAIVQRQDPGVFHDLFELNKLNPNAFRNILAELLQQRVSVRNIVLVCDSLLKGDTENKGPPYQCKYCLLAALRLLSSENEVGMHITSSSGLPLKICHLPLLNTFPSFVSGPVFGARFVGRTYPDPINPPYSIKPPDPIKLEAFGPAELTPTASEPLTLLQIDPHDQADIAWVRRMARLAAQQSDAGHLSPSASCCHSAVGWPHIGASWRAASQSLKRWSTEAPVIVLAANAKKQVLGLCLGHVERLHHGLGRQYTNFPAKPLPLNQPAQHSQVEKLYSNALSPGVGKALLTAFAQCLPPGVKQVNLCGMHPSLSAKALKLYQGMGFKAQPDLLDTPRVEPRQPRKRWLTFRQLMTTPMTVTLKTLKHHASAYAEKSHYKATDEAADIQQFTLFVPPEKATAG